MPRRRRTHPGLVAWAEATEACLAIRRAALRALFPDDSPAQLRARLARELMAHRRESDRLYARHG